MADIKTSGQLWAEIGKAVDQAPHKKVSNSQLDDILARLGTPLRDANGRPVKNITGFELDEWKAAGQRAKVVHGLPYPEPSWNPVYVLLDAFNGGKLLMEIQEMELGSIGMGTKQSYWLPNKTT
jgi:hypothetical protein